MLKSTDILKVAKPRGAGNRRAPTTDSSKELFRSSLPKVLSKSVEKLDASGDLRRSSVSIFAEALRRKHQTYYLRAQEKRRKQLEEKNKPRSRDSPSDKESDRSGDFSQQQK
jgi:hypothetical protein